MHSFRLKTIHPKFQLKNHPKNRHPFSHVVPFFFGGGIVLFSPGPQQKNVYEKKGKNTILRVPSLGLPGPGLPGKQ